MSKMRLRDSNVTASSPSSSSEEDENVTNEEVRFKCRLCDAIVTIKDKEKHRLMHKKKKDNTRKRRSSSRRNDSVFSPTASVVTIFEPVAIKRKEAQGQVNNQPAAKKRSYKRYDTAETEGKNFGG
ncbi:hypothetical protein Ocin01_11890 [Orchesella cincta]|uniref:Uncharacterized protein n=1 Tax=Orchesella cincta TaxID=48709 RepID=A0A1D2MP23_ORCCI|nr:hypothetical protein Ocin01_11890 [Orchesella cincta]